MAVEDALARLPILREDQIQQHGHQRGDYDRRLADDHGNALRKLAERAAGLRNADAQRSREADDGRVAGGQLLRGDELHAGHGDGREDRDGRAAENALRNGSQDRREFRDDARQKQEDTRQRENDAVDDLVRRGDADEEIAAECKSWATYGKPADRQRNIVTSLELQSEKMEIINKRLQEKYKALEENEVRYEAIDCDDADYVIVAFGSSARICSATVEMARAEGLKVGLLRPITLYPFPKKPLAELAARGVKGFLSAELNAGQMVEDVRLAVNGAAPVEHFGRQGGMMFAPDEVLAALKEKLIKK